MWEVRSEFRMLGFRPGLQISGGGEGTFASGVVDHGQRYG